MRRHAGADGSRLFSAGYAPLGLSKSEAQSLVAKMVEEKRIAKEEAARIAAEKAEEEKILKIRCVFAAAATYSSCTTGQPLAVHERSSSLVQGSLLQCMRDAQVADKARGCKTIEL